MSITVKNLLKVYGQQRAVDGISFFVNPGEIVGFLGPNGAGKSTTVKMITGYLQPDSGSASVSGIGVSADPMAVSEQAVTFRYKDYRDSGKKKLMCLSNEEFVRRFAQHILPLRFVRIRHYGILSSTWKRGKLQHLQSTLHVVRPPKAVNTRLRKCPCCKTCTLIVIEVFGRRRPPGKYFMENQPLPANLN